MQLSSYDHLTPENIVFNEAKEYKGLPAWAGLFFQIISNQKI